jgi:hypothetical protein
MSNYFSANFDQILDGLLFGLGVLAVYLGAVFTGALIRSLGGAGSKGLTVAGRYVTGWVYYLRGDDRDIVNVTLNIIVDNHLKFDTLVADRRTWLVWPNAYRQRLIRLASLRTTEDNPVILFPDDAPLPKSWGGRFRRRCDDMLQDMLATVKIVKDGKTRRVRLQRESDYKATYGPLISIISEKCNNDNSIDLALGREMTEHRFVIGLTYERLHDRRARHLRAMVILEDTLRNLPRDCPKVDVEEHKTRYRTLQSIAQQYAKNPAHFGVVRVWRPKHPARSDIVARDLIGEAVRLSPAQPAT